MTAASMATPTRSRCAVSTRFDGTAYGIPRDFDTIALYYNKDLFDKAGVEYPTADWTWDDLRAAAEKLTVKEGDNTTQWGTPRRMNGQQNWYNLIWQNEGEILNEDQTEALLDEAATCEALQFAGDFHHDGFSPSVAGDAGERPARNALPGRV